MSYKNPKINELLNKMSKDINDEMVIDLKETSKEYPRQCSYGSVNLDIHSGGGLPEGRLVEIYGWESSGKTTIVISAIAACQKEYPVSYCAIIDMEHALDYGYVEKLGVDLERLIVLQPDSAEEAIDAYERMVNSGLFKIVALDSVAALVPEAELEGESGDIKVALLARLMSQHCRKVTGVARKNGTTCIYINQWREKITMFGDPRTLPGGNALKFYCSQMLDVSSVAKIDEGGKNYIGNETKVLFKKNKLAPPFKEAFFNIIYGKGISRESEIVGAAIAKNVLLKTGAGVILGFETPIWSGVIDTTEQKTIDILQTVEFGDLFNELKLRLDVELGKMTEESLNETMEPCWAIHRAANEEYQKYMALANTYSGKSKHIECLYCCQAALKQKPLDKTAAKKALDMEKKIEARLLKGEELKGEIKMALNPGVDESELIVFLVDEGGKIII